MTSDDLHALYELGSPRELFGVWTQEGHRRADGRRALLHRLDRLPPDQRADVLARLPRLTPTDAALVWEVIDVDGAPIVITGPLPDEGALVPWLASRDGAAAGSLTATVPRLPTDPAAGDNGDQSGSLTALFSQSVVSPDTPLASAAGTLPPALPSPTATMSTPVLPAVPAEPVGMPESAGSRTAVPPMDPKPTRITVPQPAAPTGPPPSPTVAEQPADGLTAILGRSVLGDSTSAAPAPPPPAPPPPDVASQRPARPTAEPEPPGTLTRIFARPSPDEQATWKPTAASSLGDALGAPPIPSARPQPRPPSSPLSPPGERRPNAAPDFSQLDRAPGGSDGPAASSAGATGILGANPLRANPRGGELPPRSPRLVPDAQPTITPSLRLPPPSPPIAEGLPALAAPRLRPTPAQTDRPARPDAPPRSPPPPSGSQPSEFTRVVEGFGREVAGKKPGAAGGVGAPSIPSTPPQPPAAKSALVPILIALNVVLAVALLVVLYIALT